MKLSRTAWNNVIIFSVMIIILLINATNDKLFPDGENSQSSSEQLLLPEHSVILTLAIHFSDSKQLLFERVGRGWQMTAKGLLVDFTEQQTEQMMFSWQQSSGLVQADSIVIDDQLATKVSIDLAGTKQQQIFSLYPLNDQLLIYHQESKLWLALPAALAKQLLPITNQ